ncbi:MAG: helix-turn-helix domain-containing protein [Acidobacteriaceae bacterium]
MTDSIPKLLTLLAVAETLSVSPHTVRKMVRDGRLRPTRICRRLLFSPVEIDHMIAESERPRLQKKSSSPQ